MEIESKQTRIVGELEQVKRLLAGLFSARLSPADVTCKFQRGFDDGCEAGFDCVFQRFLVK